MKNVFFKAMKKSQFLKVNCLLSTSGFTLMEMIIVIAIITTLSIAGIVGYSSFQQSLELSNAEEQVVGVVEGKKIEIIQGGANCVEIVFEKGQKYFLSSAHNQRLCNADIPLVSSIKVVDDNRVEIVFVDGKNEKTIQKTDDFGARKTLFAEVGEERVLVDVEGSQNTKFVIFEENDRANTESEWGVYFYALENTDPEKVDHILSSVLRGKDVNNQFVEGDTLKLSLAYPESKLGVDLDGKFMRSASVELTKLGTVLDPTEVFLGSIQKSLDDATKSEVVEFMSEE